MKTIHELQLEMDDIASRINASQYRNEITIPTTERVRGEPWYEVVDSKYYAYWNEERRAERHTTVIKDANEFLYLRTQLLIGRMAGDWAIQHRQPGVDPRRVLFAKKLELWGQVDKQWQQRASAQIEKTLSMSPYKDNL